MGGLCKIIGVLAIIGTAIGFLPLLGWYNWLNIPFAVFALLLGVLVWGLGNSPGAKDGGKAGAIMGLVAIGIGLLRLVVGGGVV